MFKLCPWGEKRPCPKGERSLVLHRAKKPLAMIRPRTFKTNREDGPEL